jgi:peptidoglycan/xylan/chitin deacetylase (PgdA/CDA1 family)
MAEMIVPILMYHSVDVRSCDYLTVGQDQFCCQVEHVVANYEVIQIGDVVRFQRGAGHLPSNPLIISFDDSLKDNIEYALPVLERFQASALFFAIAGYLGQNNAWNHRAYRFSDHMSPQDLKGLAQAGHEIGSHSLTHQRLTKLSDEQMEEEFALSRQMIADIVGVPPNAFSYPYGGVDRRCARLCQKHYEFGFSSARQGCFDWTVDSMNIRRIYVSPDDQPQDLDKKIADYRQAIPHA